VDLTLDDEEAGVLREILEQTIRDLHYEIASTDNPEYKRDLRHRGDVLEAIRSKVGS